MNSKYRAIGELIENGCKYTIYRDDKNNKYYKYNDEHVEMIQPSEYSLYQMMDSLNDYIVFDKTVKVIEEKSMKAAKITYNVLLSLLCLGLACYGVHKLTRNYEPKTTYINSEKTTDDINSLFTNTINANKTINDEYKKELLDFLSIYIDECNKMEITNEINYSAIAKEISKLNVEDTNQVSLDELIDIFAIPNGKFIACELYYNKKTKKVENPIDFYIYFHENIKKDILNGYNIKINTGIKSYTLNLEDYSQNNDKLIEYLEKYMKDTIDEKLIDHNYHHFIANIFSPYMEDLTSAGVSYYYELQEDKMVEVTDKVYYKKLMDLVYSEGLVCDYNNKKYRELVYLYAESLKLNIGYQWTDNVVEYIYESIMYDDLDFSNITKEEFMKYLNGGKLDLKSLTNLSNISIWGEETLGLMQELNICFKLDVEDGYLAEEDYNNFIDYIEKTIERLYPERLKEFQEANNNNSHISDYKIELLPSITI